MCDRADSSWPIRLKATDRGLTPQGFGHSARLAPGRRNGRHTVSRVAPLNDRVAAVSRPQIPFICHDIGRTPIRSIAV